VKLAFDPALTTVVLREFIATVRPETHEPLTRFLFEADDDHPWWHFRRILDRTMSPW
jgi:hypothetical protein